MARLPLAFSALISLGIFAGCGGSSDSASGGPGVVADSAADLRAANLPRLRVGESLTLRYNPPPADIYESVPYMVVELQRPVLASETAPAGLSIRSEPVASPSVVVTGEFPGVPEVLVVNERAEIVSRAETSLDGLRDVAVVGAPDESGRQFVLIRDLMWSKPMDFVVSAPAL